MYIAKECVACGSKRLIKSPSVLMPFVADRALDWGPVEMTTDWGLQSIEIGTLHCRTNSVACKSCHTVFLDLRFGDDEIKSLYKDYRGADYNAKRTMYEPEYSRKSSVFSYRYPYLANAEIWIQRHITPETVLDWGGDDGLNSLFRGTKSKIYLHDISGVVPKYGTQMYSKKDADICFDLVTCNQVLEHVPEPLKILEEIRAIMSPHTWLYFDLPFEKIMQGDTPLDKRLERKKHWHEHINFFSAEGIKQLVKQAGLNFVELRSISATNRTGEDLIFQVLCNNQSYD
ncbi:class I SAM-dependent methyltransferase [Alphaproteobacteria bacterium]|nr:class I SAM-dependent methyltransferase [Alphaproteobacteria bacterium]